MDFSETAKETAKNGITQKLSVNNKVIVVIGDNERISTKEITREVVIADPQTNAGSIYTAIYTLKKLGYIGHVGYQRYELTDLGRAQMGRILQGNNPEISLAKAQALRDSLPSLAKETEVLPEVVETPTTQPPQPQPWEMTADINWQAEFLKTHYRLLDILDSNHMTRKEN